ncbi:MAG: ribonuclease HII, partial [Beijerinckiaceae bacterium]
MKKRVSAAGPDFSHEQAALAAGFGCIAGVDEAGRGPLAGPVVVAAVVLDPQRLPAQARDSKKLSAAQRDAAFEEILATARAVSVVSLPPTVIDQLNILRATLTGMQQAVSALAVPPNFVLVDGRDLPDLPCGGKALIGGDDRSLSIAAASIVAKVTRDRMMRRLNRAYPVYGFDRHMGYGTAMHRATIT